MAKLCMDVDTALSEVPVNFVALTDDTDFKTREVSVTYDQAGMDLVWNFVTTAGVFTQTAVTPTTAGDYDWTNQGKGDYTIEIPASGGASINNDTEGFGWFNGFATGILPWTGPIITFRAAGINNKMIDDVYSATRGLAGTALPAAAADGVGGLPISDAGGLDIDAKLANTNEITVARMEALTDWLDGGRLDLILDIIAADTTTDIPMLIAALPTAAQNRIEMDVNSVDLNALINGVADLLSRLIGTIAAGTHNAQGGDNYARIGVAGAGLTNINLPNQTMDIIGNITGNLLGSVGSVTDKLGFALSATGLNLITEIQAGVIEFAKAFWNRILSGATHNITNSGGKRLRQIQEAGGYEGGFVWVDTVDGTGIGTVPFEDGTITSKCLLFSNAITVAGNAALNIKQFSISSDSTITLAATLSDRVMVGHGWVLQLGSQNIAGSHVIDAEISGISSGSNWEFHDSKVDDLTADAGTLHNCYVSGVMVFTEAGQYHLHNCHAGDGGVTPKINIGSVVGDTILLIHNWHGKLALQNCGQVGDDEINLTGVGEIDIEASCIAGVINVQGGWIVTGAAAFISAGGTINYDDNTVNIADIKAQTDLQPEGIKQNTAYNNFEFKMVLASDNKSPATGLMITSTRSIDGGAFASTINTAVEVGNGFYRINFSAADLNGKTISFIFNGGVTANVTDLTFILAA